MDIKAEYLKVIKSMDEWRKGCEERALANIPTLSIDPISVSYSIGMDLWLVYPYNRKLMPIIQAELEAQGWKFSSTVEEKDIKTEWQGPRVTFHKELTQEPGHWQPDVCIIIEFSDTVAGAVCKRHQIGTRTEETPVYEFACQEA